MNHTPIPWIVRPEDQDHWVLLNEQFTDRGKVTIKIVGHIDSKANAIFIAKAVNHYAKLAKQECKE